MVSGVVGSIFEMTSLMVSLAAETSAVTVTLTVAVVVTILMEAWAWEAETTAVRRQWPCWNRVVAVAMEVGMGRGGCGCPGMVVGGGGGDGQWWKNRGRLKAMTIDSAPAGQ